MRRTPSTAPVAASVLVLALVLVPGAVAGQTDGGATRSVLDGVYTEEQADRGETVFRRNCSACHASGFFSGEPFRMIWAGQPASRFWSAFRNTMPFDNPGGLRPEEYAAVLAYVFRLNGYPAGERELPSEAGALEAIVIDEPTPGGR